METINYHAYQNLQLESQLFGTTKYHIPQCGMNSSKPRRTSLGKKALFFTSVPFYWGLFFKGLLGWFNPYVFGAVVVVSLIMSLSGNGWGLLDNLAH